MSVETNAPSVASLDEVVQLLREQNELLRKLVGNATPEAKASRFSEEDWAKAKAIAATVTPSEETRHVVVDVATGEYATGRTIFAAADALGAPPDRTVALLAGGGTLRLRSPGRVRV